jgi:hypothetical protein
LALALLALVRCRSLEQSRYLVRSQTISGNGGHDNHGRSEKVSDPKMKEIGD